MVSPRGPVRGRSIPRRNRGERADQTSARDGPVEPSWAPDFLAIGHMTRDRTPDGFASGGAVTYGALTAQGMGLKAAIVTSASVDNQTSSNTRDIPVHEVPATETTTFHNVYSGGKRIQFLEGIGSPIMPNDVPVSWRSAPLVLLGPVVGEVTSQMALSFPDSLVVASIQGWLRRWDFEGRVTPKPWEGREVLPHIDAAVVSIGDIGDRRLIDLWAKITPVLIVTMGGEGARLHSEGGWHDIAPFPTTEVDSTGAGDVFAGAYLAKYHETRQPLESARFASCAASFCVEADGVAGIPTVAQVQERLKSYDR